MELPVTWTLHRSGGFVLVGRYSGLESVHNNTDLQKNIKVAAFDLVCKLIEPPLSTFSTDNDATRTKLLSCPSPERCTERM
jgi:hypothetical protein